MKIINKGYINFNEQYNKKTDKFMTASKNKATSFKQKEN